MNTYIIALAVVFSLHMICSIIVLFCTKNSQKKLTQCNEQFAKSNMTGKAIALELLAQNGLTDIKVKSYEENFNGIAKDKFHIDDNAIYLCEVTQEDSTLYSTASACYCTADAILHNKKTGKSKSFTNTLIIISHIIAFVTFPIALVGFVLSYILGMSFGLYLIFGGAIFLIALPISAIAKNKELAIYNKAIELSVQYYDNEEYELGKDVIKFLNNRNFMTTVSNFSGLLVLVLSIGGRKKQSKE